MKLSVSIPDELWRQVATPDDSASQVIQAALAERARIRESERQREAVPGHLRQQIAANATTRFNHYAKLSFELGYECGGAALELLEWPEVETFRGTDDPLAYLEQAFAARMDAIQEQRGPTYDASADAEEANERALTAREGTLIGQLATVVDTWDEILLDRIERDGPVTEAEIRAEVAAREGIEDVARGSDAYAALAPFRTWLTEVNVGYGTWAKGFSRALEDARTDVLTNAHLAQDVAQ